MDSGLMSLTYEPLLRMWHKLAPGNFDELIEYVAGNAVWEFPAIPGEDPDEQDCARRKWPEQVASLDTAVMSLLGEEEDRAALGCLLARTHVEQLRQVHPVLLVGVPHALRNLAQRIDLILLGRDLRPRAEGRARKPAAGQMLRRACGGEHRRLDREGTAAGGEEGVLGGDP
jgi:hypothetical protein